MFALALPCLGLHSFPPLWLPRWTLLSALFLLFSWKRLHLTAMNLELFFFLPITYVQWENRFLMSLLAPRAAWLSPSEARWQCLLHGWPQTFVGHCAGQAGGHGVCGWGKQEGPGQRASSGPALGDRGDPSLWALRPLTAQLNTHLASIHLKLPEAQPCARNPISVLHILTCKTLGVS